MKIKFLIFYILAFASLSCENKKSGIPLYLFALLNPPGSGDIQGAISGNTNTIAPTEAPDPAIPPAETNPSSSGTITEATVKVTLEELLAVNDLNLCPEFGGILLSFEKGSSVTCRKEKLTTNCAKSAVLSDSSPWKVDPRSYVGYTLPSGLEDPSFSYPSDGKSLAFCFDREKPGSVNLVKMYAYRNRSAGAIPNNCPRAMTGEFCDDYLALSTPTKFKIPKEFPLVTESGSTGNSGDHWLELKYKNELNKFVTCIYRGNNLNSFGVSSGEFTKNAYIGGNPTLQYRKGYCLVCSANYCNYNLGSGLGPFTEANAIDSEYVLSSVVGTTVVARDFIFLSVKNGNGPLKHTVSWILEGFEPEPFSGNTLGIEAYLDGSIQNNSFLVAFLLAILGLGIGIILKKRGRTRF